MKLTATLPVDQNQNPINLAYNDMSYLYDYNASGNIVYIGKGSAGTNSNVLGWQIQKLQYDTAANNNISSILYADGDNFFDNNWTARSSAVFL